MAWRALAALGVVFVVVGGVDALLVWFPTSFGQADWEFGTVTAGLNGLPLPLVGVALVLGDALMNGKRVVVRVVAVLLLVLAAMILAMGVLYATDIPLALRAVGPGESVARLGVEKSMFKTISQLVSYPTGLIIVGVMAWRSTRSEA